MADGTESGQRCALVKTLMGMAGRLLVIPSKTKTAITWWTRAMRDGCGAAPLGTAAFLVVVLIADGAGGRR
jgi:hypothetical protein